MRVRKDRLDAVDVIIEPGSVPWRPNASVRDVDVWNAYDIPAQQAPNPATEFLARQADFEARLGQLQEA